MIYYRCSPYNAPVDGVWLAIGVLLFNRPLNYSLPINEHWSTANPRTQTFYAAEIAKHMLVFRQSTIHNPGHPESLMLHSKDF